jgi:hypothetical protein
VVGDAKVFPHTKVDGAKIDVTNAVRQERSIYPGARFGFTIAIFGNAVKEWISCLFRLLQFDEGYEARTAKGRNNSIIALKHPRMFNN